MIRLFRHYVPRSMIMLVLIESAVLWASIYLGTMVRVFTAPYMIDPARFDDHFVKALVFMLVMLAIMTGMGLYERNFWDGKVDMILRVSVSFLLGLFVMTLIYYMFPDLYLGRGEFGYSFSAAFVGVVIARYVFLQISDRDILKRRVLVLGAGQEALQIERMLVDADIKGLKIVGYLPLQRSCEGIDPDKILQWTGSLRDITEKYQVDELVVAVDGKRLSFPMDEVLECKISGVEVVDLLTFFERESGRIKLEALSADRMLFSDGFHQAVLKRTSKRFFDIAASLLLLLLTWPIMLLAVLAIWVESGFRGPIFYLQERIGKDERVFKVIKFRSMHVDAEKDGIARWAGVKDSRVTLVGTFIRATRIDELPQLTNVLKGHMSFVGPRPERPQFVNELREKIPFYSMRHRVNPGITGWAQICYPYGASEEDAKEKLQYDLYYIKNYSLFLDLMVLIQTAHVIFWSKGAR